MKNYSAPACIHNGVSHKVGEKWEAPSGFMYTCVGGENPRINISGITMLIVVNGQTKIYNCCIIRLHHGVRWHNTSGWISC